MPYNYRKSNFIFMWLMARKRNARCYYFGIFWGFFSRTLHDIYVDYRSAEGLIAAVADQ
jgi:hypothetical protein